MYESVPPRLYGGTERVVSNLTEALVAQGHEVTLFATGDSRTRARLVRCASQGLRLDDDCRDVITPHVLMVEQAFQHAADFDVLHFHTEPFHFPLARRTPVPCVTTLHGRLDGPQSAALYHEYPALPLVSISHAQREPIPWATWMGTVYHGLPADLFSRGHGRGGYFAFLGRFSPEKGPDRAIEIARRAGVRLKMSAKIDRLDQAYFESVVEPLLSTPGVEFVGEIDERQKQAFLGDALGLLFPIDWPEPFGMVMIESLACGTPVIATSFGSVTEIIEDGRTGFIAANLDEAVDAVRRIGAIDRRACRVAFEERFTADRMADDYVDVYERMVESMTSWAA